MRTVPPVRSPSYLGTPAGSPLRMPSGRGSETLTQNCSKTRNSCNEFFPHLAENFALDAPNGSLSRVSAGDLLGAAKAGALERCTRGRGKPQGRGWIASRPWPLVHQTLESGSGARWPLSACVSFFVVAQTGDR